RPDEREGADDEGAADPHEGEEVAHPSDERADAERLASSYEDQPEEPRRACPLRDYGRDRGAADPPPRAEDQDRVEDEVHQVEADRDVQWRARVLPPPEDPVARGDDQDRRPREGADPQVLER